MIESYQGMIVVFNEKLTEEEKMIVTKQIMDINNNLNKDSIKAIVDMTVPPEFLPKDKDHMN